MRRFFIFFFISFASLFFSQCEIWKISFALGDVLMFFINGKVEAVNKNNKIQGIDKIELEAVERPEEKIQQFDEIKLQAKEKELNFLKETQELSILPKQRAENIIEKIESIELLEIVKPQIKPEKVINEIYFHGVVKPQNEIERREDFLIKEKKREALRIHKNEKFGIVNVTPRKFSAQVLSLGSNKEFSFLPKVTTSKNNKIIDGEKIQIHGKESAKVIELRETAKAMLKVLEEYENGYKEDFEYIQKAGLGDEVLQIKDEGAAIKKIMEIVKEKAKEERMKDGIDITEENLLDKDKIEEFMNEKDDFKCEIGKINKKFLASKEEFSALKNDYLDLYLDNMMLLVDQQKLKEELYNIKEASGCNKGVEGEEIVQNIGTPSSKKNISKKYTESGIILSNNNTQNNNTQNKNLRFNSGYSMDKKIFIDEQNEIKEDRQSMRSSISRRMNFRSSSWSQNNRNSFPSFFDWKKFYTDPRQQKTFIYDNIYDISQEKVPNNAVLKEDKNVITNIKECHETSLQFQNKNAGLILNNVDENETRQKLGESENKIFKKIDIKDNKKKTRKSYGGIMAANTSKGDIVRNNRTTVIGFKGKDIKDGVRNFKFNKFDVAGKKLGSHTSFNTFNNKSTTFLSNSGLDKDKFGGKNIINNTFGQKIKIQVRNIEGRNKQLKYEDKKQKKQTEQLEEENNTTKSTSRMDIQENSDKNVEKIKKKISVYLKKIKGMNKGNAVQKDDKKITIHNKMEDEKIQKKENKNEWGVINGKKTYQKLPQQNIINRLTENNAGRKDTKRDLNKVEDKKIVTYNSFRNIKKEKSVISKNSENSNNSNSFVSLGGKGNSINLDAKRLNEKKFDIKKGENGKDDFQKDKKDVKKNALFNRFKKK